MAKVLITYYSSGGNTARMAAIIEGAIRAEGVEVACKKVGETTIDDLLEHDGVVMGSPTYFGTMAAELKRLIDDSVEHHGKLDGKVGGAFTSSANIAGGNETTILDILKALMIHGMIVQGDVKGDHYGPVAIGAPDERSRQECVRYGQRIAQLVKRLGAQ